MAVDEAPIYVIQADVVAVFKDLAELSDAALAGLWGVPMLSFLTNLDEKRKVSGDIRDNPWWADIADAVATALSGGWSTADGIVHSVKGMDVCKAHVVETEVGAHARRNWSNRIEVARELCVAAMRGTKRFVDAASPDNAFIGPIPVEFYIMAFQQQKERLIDDLKAGALGEFVAHCFAIEFQKRGLPHIHLLLWTKGGRAVADIDAHITAELCTTSARVFDAQAKAMMHKCTEGHCGQDGYKEFEVCDKHFPKRFHDGAFHVGVDQYPVYRRRSVKDCPGFESRRSNECRNLHLDAAALDNSFAVPTNLPLFWRNKCHLNVEAVAGAKSIKYVHSYLYKGVDRASESRVTEYKAIDDLLYRDVLTHFTWKPTAKTFTGITRT
eukprot:g7732.t1